MSVQNRYNLADRDAEDVLEACERDGLGFIPWFPLAAGELDPAGPRDEIAAAHDATPAQIALAWLLHALAGDAADPRHVVGRAPRGERRPRPPWSCRSDDVAALI